MNQRLPNVMVLVFEERLGHSIWMDSPYRRERTLRGLVQSLAKQVRAGEIVGYRLMRTELEITGICPEREREFLEQASAKLS